MISLGLLVQITPCEVDTIRACCFYFAFCAFSVNFMTKSFPPLIAQQLIKSEIHVQWPDKQHVPYLNAVITKDVSLLWSLHLNIVLFSLFYCQYTPRQTCNQVITKVSITPTTVWNSVRCEMSGFQSDFQYSEADNWYFKTILWSEKILTKKVFKFIANVVSKRISKIG